MKKEKNFHKKKNGFFLSKERNKLFKMFFSSISTLPFSNLNNENLNKEELIKELEKENIGIGNETKNKKLNIIPTTGKKRFLVLYLKIVLNNLKKEKILPKKISE